MNPKFLVINSIGTLRRQTVQILMNLGYSGIKQASSTEEARRIIASSNISNLVVVLELTIAGLTMDEELFLRQFSQNNSFENIPVVVTSRRADISLIHRLSGLRVQDLLLKSDFDESFSHCMGKAIEKHISSDLPGQDKRMIQKDTAIA